MRHSLIRFVLVVTCVAGLALPALAQAPQFGTGLEVADYKTVGYLVEGLSNDEAEMGLNENRLQTRVELRLRQAGLVPALAQTGQLPYLSLEVTVHSQAFAIRLRFMRLVSFSDSGRDYYKNAAVWSTGATGIHAGDPEYIVGSVDQRLDEFLNEYLKVNQG